MSAAPLLTKPTFVLKRILFATDFSPASFTALPMVGALARRYNVEVEVLHALPPTPVVMPEGAAYVQPSTEPAAEKMHHLLHADVLQGLKLKWVVRLGLPSETIIDEATDCRSDLIVVGTHGFGGLKHFLLGSVCEELARTAPCPVLTIGPHADKRFSRPEGARRILVPVDFSPESLSVLPYIMPIAGDFDAVVTFLHVRSRSEEEIPRAQSKYFIGKMRRMFAPHVPQHCETRYLVESGAVAETILSVANDIFADLIAMGVRNKEDVGFQIRGSNTYKVIAGGQCPVLINHRR